MTTIVAPVNEPKLRVTILGLHYSPEPSGNAPYTTGLAEGLSRAGHSVTVITGYPHYPEWRRREGFTGWFRQEHINGVDVRRLRHHIPTRPTTLSRLHMELSFGLRILFTPWSRPDAVILVSPALFSSGMATLRAKLQRRKPIVITWVQDIYSRGLVETGTGSSNAAALMGRVESWVLRSSDGVVAIHNRFRDYIVRSLAVPEEDVRVIRNWTHLPASPTSSIETTRCRLGWKPDQIVVLHAGNMGKKQGLENVVEAARLAQQKSSAVHFVLMGDGNQRRRLESLAAGIDHLSFIDPLPGHEFQEALAAADFLLVNELSGVKEMAVPSKLTSYFNAGVPVLAATDSGSVTDSEIAASGGGITVAAGDAASLVNTASSLGRGSALGASLGDAGLRFRRETLSESTALGQYDEFLLHLASSRGR